MKAHTWRVIALIFVFTLAMPVMAQDTAPAQPDTADFYQQVFNLLIVVIVTLSSLSAALGVALWNSVPARVVMSGAVNLARFTPSPDDDARIAKAIELSGGVIDKSGDVWLVRPRENSAPQKIE